MCTASRLCLQKCLPSLKLPGQQIRAASAPIGSNSKIQTRQTFTEMTVQPLKLEDEHIEVVPSIAAGKRSVISDAGLEMLLDRHHEVFEGCGIGWKSGAAAAKARANVGYNGGAEMPRRRRMDTNGGLFEAPVDEGNDALAQMPREDGSASH
ncbi:hypothetical protein EI94DRAFT_1700718 [Lactarius quietus]|nr:hypothetical protein EI94DRAFT_1700718 [Lactarius quietus]